MYENYLYRLQNVTGIENNAGDHSPSSLPVYPRQRDLKLTIEEIRVDFSEFLDLGQCDLQHQISTRNSSLGRILAPSQKLLYEVEFYRSIKTCRKQSATSTESANRGPQTLAGLVDEIHRIKSRNLPKVFWNATFAGPEFGVLLTTQTKALQRNEDVGTAAAIAALEYLTKFGRELDQAQSELSSSQLEQHLFALQQNKLVGKLLHGLQLSRHYLASASEILEKARAQNKLCPNGAKTTQAEYLRNVFRKFYINEVQRYLSRIHQPAKEVLKALNDLRKIQRVKPPPAFERFRQIALDTDVKTSVWVGYRSQVNRHTKAWQLLLNQCNLMPNSATKPEH